MDFQANHIAWQSPAGKRLEAFARSLPPEPKLDINTREIWKILWNKEIDVRAAIIRPALERARHDYEPPDPNLKTRLANLKLPGKN